MRVLATVLRCWVAMMLLGSGLAAQEAAPASPSLLKATFGKLPLYFVENRGVYPEEVGYYIQGADKTLFFTREGITFRLKGQDRGWVVKLEFVGANPEARPEGLDKQQAIFSYFKGPENDWKTGLRTYSGIVYRDLWPRIDLVYKGTVNRLKYEFAVAPGGDPAKIRLRYRGASKVEATGAGGLRVMTPASSFEDAPPVAWQEIDGKRVPVEVSFRLDAEAAGEGTAFGFQVGDYDHARPLVLDPAVMVYCGYIGGSSHDSSGDIAVDRAGNAYVTGFTDSDNQTFPVKVGPDLAHYSGEDAFVAKVNAQGTALVYCGYIGGSASERGYGIAVDSAGNAYVTGETGYVRNDFPVKVGPDLTHNGYYDAFVAKVNAQGTALVYCGYIGGSYLDVGYGIAVDSAGSAYVTGLTASTEATFPVKLGPDLISNGGADAFVAKVSASGMGLDYCGFVGGSNADEGRAIAVDGSGNAYVAGSTWSTEATFPVKGGPDLTSNGGEDAFVAKVDAQGKALEYCGYIGGNGWDIGNGIAVGAAGTAFVSGITFSTEQTFPVKGGPDLTHNGGIWDAFVAKVNAQGTALAYCGYIGGNGYDYGGRVATDAAGFAYVAGWTESDQQTFPVAVGPDLTHNGGVRDAFVAKVAAQGTGLVYCGYIGGSGEELGGGIAVDPSGNAHVAGWTRSTEQTFPVTVGPDVTHNSPLGQADAFVAKIVLTLLQASGPPRPGGTEILTLTATQDAGLSFQLGSSLGTGPIPIDTRQIDLSPDGLLAVSVGGWWPPVFQGYQGIIDPNGQAQAAIHIPNFPALIGLRLHTAFVTLDPQAPSGIKSISNTFSFTITK